MCEEKEQIAVNHIPDEEVKLIAVELMEKFDESFKELETIVSRMENNPLFFISVSTTVMAVHTDFVMRACLILR